MIDNKLFELIETLSGVEKRECTNFLKSPYFNQRPDVLLFWQFILAAKNKIFTAESAFEAAYPGETFEDRRWRYLQSFLLQRIEDFLAQRASERNTLFRDLQLAGVYRQKRLDKHWHSVLRRCSETVVKMPHEKDHFYWQYQLEWEQYAAVESQARARENNLPAVNQALDLYMISSKLRLACLMESHKAVYNTDYDTVFLSALLAVLDQSTVLQEPVVALYYHCYRALTAGDESDFRAFRRELESQHAGMPDAERRIFLLLAVNFCIKRLNSGELRYVREAFDLYRVGLDTHILLENEILSRFAYKNIVALGLRLEEFEWVEQFIFRYEPMLEARYRAANRNYNLARLRYAQKDYNRAMPLLAQVDESDLFLNIDSRVMLLKMYYETDAWDALDALLSSFKILLLRKKKIIGYHYTYYSNTLRYMQKLTKLNFRDKKALSGLRAELENEGVVLEKEWLLAALAV